MQKLDFNKFNAGTLFLIRTPEHFPAGYAAESFRDMKENLHLDYAAWLETWNCMDGIIWQHPDYPRSSYWQGCDRDPLEETFLAADEVDMAFLPEAGVMHDSFMLANPDAMLQNPDGTIARYGRVGLVPACPLTADFFIAKYEALIEKYGHHPSFKGICMPAENGARLSYDRYTRDAYYREFGCQLPAVEQWSKSTILTRQICTFTENLFLEMYRKLARHLKSKYALPLMHYPQSKVSAVSFHEPNEYYPTRNLELIEQVSEIDLLNLQLHPPLGDNPRQFKLELELLESIARRPFVADTHFYHETNAGKLPDLVPKRFADWILGTLTPYGVSFFCYGFMAEKLPLWKAEINENVKVASCYADDDAVMTRRKSVKKAMDFAELLSPYLSEKKHTAQCAVFYRESVDEAYRYGSYYREHLFGLYEAIQSAAMPLVFTGEIPANGDEIKLLIFDAVKEITAEDGEKLRNYLKNGGQIILVGKCAAELYDICGFTVVETDGEYVTASGDDKWLFYVPVDAVKLTADGENLYSYNSGAGAVVRNGRSLFIGAGCAVSDFSNMRQYGMVNLWKYILRRCNADSGVKLYVPYLHRYNEHEYLSCDIYCNDKKDELLLFIRNFGVEANVASLNWQLPENFTVKEVICDGRNIDWKNGEPLPGFEYFTLLSAGK